jgi:hypothetical protein
MMRLANHKNREVEMKTRQVLVLASALIFSSHLLYAQTHVVEKNKDKKAIAADRVSVRDDRHDLNRLSDLVMKWDQLRTSTPNSEALKKVEQEIYAELRRDVKEAKTEVKEAKKEVIQSTHEVHASQVEKAHERHDRDGDRRALRDDKKDLRDDRRDRRDDVRDEKKAEELLTKKRAISQQLIDVQKKIDAAGPRVDKLMREKQSDLLEEYLTLSQEEVKLGLREIKEDKKELREDRRETREDRRK